MKKTLIAASLLVLLCGPALADVNHTVDITLTTNPKQTYSFLVVDNSCADMEVKIPKHEAFFKICAKAADKGNVQLELERRTRDDATEITNHAVVTTAPKGSFTLGDLKIALQ
jgi:hypothetical protein